MCNDLGSYAHPAISNENRLFVQMVKRFTVHINRVNTKCIQRVRQEINQRTGPELVMSIFNHTGGVICHLPETKVAQLSEKK